MGAADTKHRKSTIIKWNKAKVGGIGWDAQGSTKNFILRLDQKPTDDTDVNGAPLCGVVIIDPIYARLFAQFRLLASS